MDHPAAHHHMYMGESAYSGGMLYGYGDGDIYPSGGYEDVMPSSGEYPHAAGWYSSSSLHEYPTAPTAVPYAGYGKGKGKGYGSGKGVRGQQLMTFQPNWDPLVGITIVVNYFRTHLLLRDYRPTGPQAGHPLAEACIKDFERFVQYVASCHREQGPLDLGVFETLCRKFSSEWEGTCHWLNHKILSSFLTKKVNVSWQ